MDRSWAVEDRADDRNAEAIIDTYGAVAIPRLIAGRGRALPGGLHFGPYDYAASCDIAAAEQRLDHPACDFARNVMQVSAAGRGVTLSDGPSTISADPDASVAAGGSLTAAQVAENRAIVHRAMRHHFDLVQRSLATAFTRAGICTPASFPTRYAAVYAFFLKAWNRRRRGCGISSTKPRRPRWWATCSMTQPPDKGC